MAIFQKLSVRFQSLFLAVKRLYDGNTGKVYNSFTKSTYL